MQDIDNKQSKSLEDHFPTETMLELIHADDGNLKLRDVNGKEDPLVSIEFSDKVKDMLGEDLHMVGQHMIHSAIQLIMRNQMNHWHAYVHDEEPEHYS